MKVKSENGITFVALIITIIILVILTYVGVHISIGITQTAQFENVKTDMLLVKSRCEILINEKAIGELDEGYYGTYQEEGTYAGWYKLSQGDLNDIGAKNAIAADRLLCKI